MDGEANLNDKTTYFWKVEAIDVQGGITVMGGNNAIANNVKTLAEEPVKAFSFTSDLSAGFPGFVKGVVFDAATSKGEVKELNINMKQK